MSIGRYIWAGAFAALVAAAPSAGAAQSASGWAVAPISKVRLIAGGMDGGSYRAGVEIILKGDAHTYWRSPGDGGVPPEFNFAGSANLKSAHVRYPAPERSGEPGMYLFGYQREVVFPLEITPQDRTRPVELALHLTYAACDKICMPAEAKVVLTLDAATKDEAQRARIDEFAARVPAKSDAAGAPQIAIAPGDKAGKAWIVKISPPPGQGADLFAEGPPNWFFDTRALAAGGFEIKLAEKPADHAGPLPPVTLTLTGKQGAWEAVRHLDAGGSKP